MAADQHSKEIFRGMVEMYWQSIWAFVYSILGDPEYAKDVTQDTFISAAVNIGELRDDARFKAWLFTIARNRSTDYLKSAWSTKVMSMDAEAVPGFTQENSTGFTAAAETDAIAAVLRSQLWTAIMQLKPGFREVVLLRTREDLSFRDIAAVLNIREGTARSRYIRAVKQLRGTLTQGGTEDA